MTVTHGFEGIREQYIPEICSAAHLYRHQRTGAELLSLANADENKVFGVAFRSPPADSTGIAHILEHSVLCGSRKYPVKAPFLELIKGSLKTFLNAFTFPDKTVYPVASTNLQDFYNLVDVYLDSVFHPRLTPEILQQEGWHYELDSTDAPLIYKGVVFNEMKGVYSSPEGIAGRAAQRSLFPDTPYGVDSGGDPRVIPDLTYEAFTAFHERCYHPSNARFFFYGDDPEDKRLEIIDRVLAEFSAAPATEPVALQPRFPEPRTARHTFAASPGPAKQARVLVNWMLDEFTDVETALAGAVLGRILVGRPASPLRKALIDSGLGEGIAGGGFSRTLRQATFSTGLKGIEETDAAKVETLILSTLAALARDGIDLATVEAAMNSIEFGLRENNTGSFPRGIVLMIRALEGWLHGRDPLEPLAWDAPLARLKTRLAGGERIFEDMIRRHLIDNPHRTALVFAPDPEQAAREATEERARLDAARAAMSDADVASVIENTRKLKHLQETPDSPEALATIPSLQLSDLPRQNAVIPMAAGDIGGTRVFTHDLDTSGIVYLDIGLDLRTLTPDLIPHLTLFRRAILETGAGKADFVELSQRIDRSTGGISPVTWTSTITDGSRAAAWLFLRAKAMPEKAGEMLAILRDVLLEPRLDDHERITQLGRELKAGLESQLIPGGHGFVARRLRGGLDEAGWAEEQMSGISQLVFARAICEEMDDGGGRVLAALARIRARLVNRRTMLCNVTADGAALRRFEPELARFLDALPAEPVNIPTWPDLDAPHAEGLTIPAKVNYVGKGECLYRLGFRPGGEVMAARQLLATGWLWEKIRVQGGAYGGMCAFDRRSGVFTFTSYRDPNLLKTLDIYDGAANYLRTAAIAEPELVRAIIGSIGFMDTYRLPDAKGMVSLQRHLAGDSEELRQRVRDEVLAADVAGVRRFADALDAVAAEGRVAVLGSAEAIAAADAEKGGGWFTMSKIM